MIQYIYEIWNFIILYITDLLDSHFLFIIFFFVFFIFVLFMLIIARVYGIRYVVYLIKNFELFQKFWMFFWFIILIIFFEKLWVFLIPSFHIFFLKCIRTEARYWVVLVILTICYITIILYILF